MVGRFISPVKLDIASATHHSQVLIVKENILFLRPKVYFDETTIFEIKKKEG